MKGLVSTSNLIATFHLILPQLCKSYHVIRPVLQISKRRFRAIWWLRSQLNPRPSDAEAHVLNINAIMHIGYRSVHMFWANLLYTINICFTIMYQLTEPEDAKIFGNNLLWVWVWWCFWMKLTLEPTDGVKLVFLPSASSSQFKTWTEQKT